MTPERRSPLRSIRGMEDRLPDAQPLWRFVEAAATEVANLYGYQRIDTPVVEPTSLFERSVGDSTDIVQKEMYSFDDRGGDSITLRPEGTASICRAYIQHGMQNQPMPVKLYYFISSFRYDRPQAGRFRQFHQFGFEALGVESPDLDIEAIAMAMAFFSRLGLADLRLMINSIGSQESRRRYLDALRDFCRPLREQLSVESQLRLDRNPLRILDSKNPKDIELVAGAPSIQDFLDPDDAAHFGAVKEGLKDLGIGYELNHRLVRGLDYYTRTVFEIEPPETGSQTALGGGGRYDPLIELLGGPPTPGIGFAAGLERIVGALARRGIQPPADTRRTIYIASLGENARRRGLTIANELREAGIAVQTSFGKRSLKAQMKHANQLEVDAVVILGDDELASNTAQLRNMTLGEQRSVPLADLASELSRI